MPTIRFMKTLHDVRFAVQKRRWRGRAGLSCLNERAMVSPDTCAAETREDTICPRHVRSEDTPERQKN